MSTYDDRLAALEQKVTTLTHDLVATQSDFLTHFGGLGRSIATLNKSVSDQEMDARDLHHNMTILLGVVGDQGQDIKAIRTDLNVVKDDLSTVKEDLGAVKSDVDAIKADLSTVKASIKEDIAALETRMLDGFKQIIAVIDSRLPPAS